MVARSNAALAQIHQQIMWSRLIAVVEEQAQTMIRTAFSTSVREAGDLSAGVFDRHGRMLAQAVTGTPGHVNSMANGVKYFLDVYPISGMKPGDHYITNDPWLTSGHLHDITVVTPSFYRGEAVGLFANTIHVVDIGGLGMGPDGRQVFEEGLSIPIMPLAREGCMNEDLLRLVRANVREPLQVEGDIYACAACNDEGSRRLIEMMDEFEIANLDRLGELDHRRVARGDAGAHPCLAARYLPQHANHGWLRQAACAQCGARRFQMTASMWISTARRRHRATASTW